MRKLILLLISSLLISCGTNKPNPMPDPGKVEPILVEPLLRAAPRVAVGNYIYKGDKEFVGYGAYGYVLFTSRSNSDRYVKVADAFLSTLENVSNFGEYDPSSLMVTSWPLVKKDFVFDSQSLVKNYDYAKSSMILASVGKSTVSGPVLVAFDKSFDDPSLIKTKLVFDMSKFSDEEIKSAFMTWKGKIAADPKYWKNGFDIASIKLEFRSFLNKYGESILSVFTA